MFFFPYCLQAFGEMVPQNRTPQYNLCGKDAIHKIKVFTFNFGSLICWYFINVCGN
jgi:hypothetical protein